MQRLLSNCNHHFMKKIAIIILIAAGLTFQSCSKHMAPGCVREKIEQYKSQPEGMKSQVDEYVFQGKTVYVLIDDRKIADGGIDVIDANCNQLCFLGGIAGFTTCNGEKFFETAVFKRTIWKR